MSSGTRDVGTRPVCPQPAVAPRSRRIPAHANRSRAEFFARLRQLPVALTEHPYRACTGFWARLLESAPKDRSVLLRVRITKEERPRALWGSYDNSFEPPKRRKIHC